MNAVIDEIALGTTSSVGPTSQLTEHESLPAGEASTFEVSSRARPATLSSKARILRDWTRRRLADELGIAEQQVQRYEATEYRSASLARICGVAAALAVDIVETARLRSPDAA